MKPSEFSNEAKGKKFKDVVSPLKQYPSFARVLSINDSIKETHDILFTAKTNLVGTNTCKQEYKTNKDEEFKFRWTAQIVGRISVKFHQKSIYG